MDKGITLKDILETVIRGRWMLVAFFVIAIAMSYFFYFTTPKSYTAEATIWPVAGADDKGMASFLAGTGLGMLTNSETKANVILVALESHTLARNVLNRYKIVAVLLNKTTEPITQDQVDNDNNKAVALLCRGVIKGFVTRNGSIVISATLKNKEAVAPLISAYLEELAIFLNRNSMKISFSVIDAAETPLEPSAPNLKSNFVKAMGIAFFFSLVFISANVGLKK